MDEFDLDLNDDMSTPISQLKNKSNLEKNNKSTYSDITDVRTTSYTCDDPAIIDTETLTPILNNNYDSKRRTIMNMMNKKQKKYKQIKHPINNFIRDLENNLDNFPIVSNKTVETFEKIPRVSFNEKENKYIPNTDTPDTGYMIHREIFISMLLFMIINNKIIIELIYNYIPSFQRMESPYPNLLLRTFIFGLILYLIKKFKL